ncbi:MAG: accessory factor UbiK family protein [Magnetococcales bacterium]|nr:accessory factor UbiK family protein [Magnetococcales bacterium]
MMQIDNMVVDQITQNILGVFSQLGESREEMVGKVREVVQEGAEHFNLATREELEVAQELLSNTRIKLENMEKRVAELEAAMAGLKDKPEG